MKSNLELIDLLRERANVSYEDAKAALEACDYDVVEALIKLEKNDRIKKTRQERAKRHESNFKSFFNEVMNIKFLVKKNRDIVINIPLVVAALFAVVTLPLFVIFIGIAIITGHKFQIKKGDEIVKVKKVFDDIKENIHDMTADEESTDAQSTTDQKEETSTNEQ